MRIGVTERGDAGLDLSWSSKMNYVDGAILITKNINEQFIREVLKQDKPLIIHCTCTGWGGATMEPNVPSYGTQLYNLEQLIVRGFPVENCVLRVDPIIPNEVGLCLLRNVLDYFVEFNMGVKRVRISIVDEYRHVKERMLRNNVKPLYGDRMYPSSAQLQLVANVLNEYEFTYELCAENFLANKLRNCEVLGCVSNKDLQLMGLPIEDCFINPQNRKGCHCLSCKTELLTERKQCAHKCVYCYWK